MNLDNRISLITNRNVKSVAVNRKWKAILVNLVNPLMQRENLPMYVHTRFAPNTKNYNQYGFHFDFFYVEVNKTIHLSTIHTYIIIRVSRIWQAHNKR